MSTQSNHIMTTSSRLNRDYWAVYKELNELANAADKAMEKLEIGSDEWYKAWGYAQGMRQACIQCLEY